MLKKLSFSNRKNNNRMTKRFKTKMMEMIKTKINNKTKFKMSKKKNK